MLLLLACHQTISDTGVPQGKDVDGAVVVTSPDPGTLAFVTPQAGATVAGTVLVEVAASDPAGITSLVLDLDGADVSSATSGTLVWEWDTCGGEDGSHTLGATVTTASGRVREAGTSVSVAQTDADGDRWSACFDCDEGDLGVHPGATEICADDIDQDCDGAAIGCGLQGEEIDADVWIGGGTAEVSTDTVVLVVDLDADGANEVVIGSPSASVSTEFGGAVRIVHGSDRGILDLDAAPVHAGAERQGGAGMALAAGDFDGDGEVELAASEPGFVHLRGAVSVFSRAEIFSDVPLADAAVRLEGRANDEGLGDELHAVDLDGDGLDDLLIGAEDARDEDNTYGGAIYIVRGPVEVGAAVSLDDAIVGGSARQYVGSELCAGDYSGDGYVDILVGTMVDLDTAAWLVPGPVSGAVVIGTQVDHLDRAAVEDRAGLSMACGDVDGDGVADPMLGAIWDDYGGEMSGAAYVVHGPISGASNLAAADVVLHGDAASTYLGYDLSFGDYDSDGRPDLAVGAPMSNVYDGQVFVFGDMFGPPPDLDAPMAHLAGTTWAGFGYSLASGDATGDGVDDLLVPSSQAPEGLNGAVWIYSGAGRY